MSMLRRKKTWFNCLSLGAVATIFAPPVPAATYVWDANGNTGGIGGSGLWLTPNLWRQDTAAGALTSWPNTTPNADTAIFGNDSGAAGTAGTVTLDSAVQANQLIFTLTGFSIGGTTSNYLTLSGTSPTITTNLGAANSIATITAPLTGTSGFTLNGNTTATANKFLVLANTSAAAPNNFTGDITITPTGALRLGGGFNEQIPDTADMYLSGVFDFITAGGVSNGKTERFRDLIVNGSQSNFSVGNGATVTIRNLSASNTGSAPGVALNGNSAALPAALVVEGDAALNSANMKLTTTSGTGAIPGAIVTLLGNLSVTGTSAITNTAQPNATESFHTLLFSAAAGTSSHTHVINVAAASTLTLSATNAGHTLLVSSANGPATLQKTGLGEWIFTDRALQSAFTGTTDIQQGTLTLGASNRLAAASTLSLSGGFLNLQTNSQSIAAILLNAGSVTGTGTLTATSSLLLQQGTILPTLVSANGLTKTTAGTVTLSGKTTAGPATLTDGQLVLAGTALAHTLTSVNGAGSLRVTASNTLTTGPVTLTSLQADGTVTLLAAGTTNTTNQLASLTLAGTTNGWTGRLEIASNLLILDPATASRTTVLSTLRNQIATGAGNTGVAAGNAGITSSTTFADPTHKITYALDNALLHLTTFGTLPVTDNALLVASTWLGDSNFDRKVNVTDLGTLATNYGTPVPNGPLQGDFNNDGQVNVTDLGLLATNYGQGTAPGSIFSLTSDLSSFPTTIPEPTTLATLPLLLLARRRPRVR